MGSKYNTGAAFPKEWVDQWRGKLGLGLVDSDGTQRQVTARTQLLVCAHTQKQGQRQIRCHSDCHKGDKLCQVLSLRGEKRRGGAEYGPNTQWHNHTPKHTHSNLKWLTGRDRDKCACHFSAHTHTHTHTQWSDASDGCTSQGHTKVPENSLTASLFLLSLKPISSEYLLVDLVQGC